MKKSESKSKVLILVGMHRSGTSLTASWLHKNGLNMGDNLLSGLRDNKKGHFEDLDFLNLHKSIFASNGVYYLISKGKKIKINQDQKDKLSILIESKSSKRPQWGFKDPRTSLLLDTWNELVPGAQYLVVFRDYSFTVDSLLRREYSKQFFKQPIFLKKAIYKFQYRMKIKSRSEEFLENWSIYNEGILDFIKTLNPEKYLVFHISNMLKKDKEIFSYLTNKWGFKLEGFSFNSIYEKKLIKDKTKFKLDFLDDSISRANTIFKKLLNLEAESIHRINSRSKQS